jgi:hypothetical protein
MDVMEGCSMHCLRASWPMRPVAPAITTFMVSLVRRRNDDTSIRDLQVRTMAPGESNPPAWILSCYSLYMQTLVESCRDSDGLELRL